MTDPGLVVRILCRGRGHGDRAREPISGDESIWVWIAVARSAMLR